jgi:hypothetical protein
MNQHTIELQKELTNKFPMTHHQNKIVKKLLVFSQNITVIFNQEPLEES